MALANYVRTAPAKVRLIPDSTYPEEATRLFRDASQRIWCSVFLIELDTRFDPDLRVATLLRELAAAHWRGVDVRLVVGGSRTNLLIAEASAAAIQFARAMGIPSRGFGQTNQRGSHVKLIVADNWILTGSHNWSGGAFGEHVQDSVLVQSAALAAYMANVFFKQWLRARSR